MSILRFLSESVSSFIDFCSLIKLFQTFFFVLILCLDDSALSVGRVLCQGRAGCWYPRAWHPWVLCELPYIPLSAPRRRFHVEKASCLMHRVASVAWFSRPAVLRERERFTDCIVVCRAGWVVSTSLAPIDSPTSSAALSVHIYAECSCFRLGKSEIPAHDAALKASG